MWGIYVRKRLNHKNDLPIAAFPSQRLCRQYIAMRREFHFFECKSMDEAEEEWGDDKFIIDRTATFSRQNAYKQFGDPTEWRDD